MRWAALFSGQGRQQPAHWALLHAQAAPSLACSLAAHLGTAWTQAPAGPEPLQHNRVAQPLIFGWQMHWWQQLSPLLPPPVCVAGYSVGEMAACAAAGGFGVDTGMALCVQRALAMDACVSAPAGLLAVLGLAAPAQQQLMDTCSLALAISNAPDHVVLGGALPDLDRAQALATDWGASKTVLLGVHTPSHTPWLAGATHALAQYLAPHADGALDIPLVSGMDGRTHYHRTSAMQALAAQVSTSLRWDHCMAALAEMQLDAVLEIGPGNALAGLWTGSGAQAPVRAVEEFRSPQGVAQWLLARG